MTSVKFLPSLHENNRVDLVDILYLVKLIMNSGLFKGSMSFSNWAMIFYAQRSQYPAFSVSYFPRSIPIMHKFGSECFNAFQ